MAYGRLDVYWPDGKFETFSLVANSISIGRSTGNTIPLETDTISRYHVSITLEDQRVAITDMDSANGTYVDGVRIESNDPRELRGGEEIQIGHLRMIYHAAEDIPTLPMDAMVEDTQRIERESVPFTIEVREPAIAVPPGSHTSAELKITNRSSEARVFIVTYEAPQRDWFRVNRPQLEIEPDETASVLLSIKPIRRSESTPGVYSVTVKIALKDEPDMWLEAEVRTTILAYAGFGMALGSSRLTANEPFRLHVHNQGSAPLPITVSGRSKGENLRFGIPTPQIMLGAGQRQVIQGEIKAARTRLIGSEKVHPFELVVHSRDMAAYIAAVPGTVTERPLMPAWAALTIVGSGIGIVILAILALLLVLNTPSPTPQITRFDTTSTTITQGDLLTLNWEVTDADHVDISVNGEVVEEDVAPEPSTFNLPTDSYDGEIIVILQAINDDNMAQAALNITVELPLVVDYFEVQPNVIVRNTVETISVRWRVRGATTTRVEGLESFSMTTVLEPSFGAEGDIQVSGIAADNFSLTLVGEDALGNTAEQVVNIDVTIPECTTRSDATIYVSPDTSSNVVGSVESGTVLIVDGRDDSGAWLRTQLPGGVVGWSARTDLECAAFFSVEELEIVEITSQPESTPQVEPTATNEG
ncbi:MAG: FHA domain-containing protein [Aggregatilineales bacterium]